MELHDLMTRQASQVELLDHRSVEWGHVRKTRYWMAQRFTYHYPGSIHQLRQRLMVVPRDHYGDQRLAAFDLFVSESGATTTSTVDSFGNRILQVYIPHVQSEVTFETRLVVERNLDGSEPARVPTEAALVFRSPTPLTAVDAEIASIARQLVARHSEPEEFSEAVNAWVYNAMHYRHGATNVQTTAAESLRIGHGLCQDYSHIKLAGAARKFGCTDRRTWVLLDGFTGSYASPKPVRDRPKYVNEAYWENKDGPTQFREWLTNTKEGKEIHDRWFSSVENHTVLRYVEGWSRNEMEG